MNNKNKRTEIWNNLDQAWDLIIVGGGITGAGILREAARLGLRVLLVEQRDFAWGTSSRSSKLVHGGLRYLKEGKVGLTRASVLEREHLLDEGPGLIDPVGFLLAEYKGDSPGRLVYTAGLTIYDLLALQWSHKYYSAQDFRLMAGNISQEGLKGGFRYGDAQTDDARLVLRVIQEAVAEGATAVNYIRAQNVLRNADDRVHGVQLHDMESAQIKNVYGRVVINATGAWADRLREQIGEESRLRPLRGSHLIFPLWRLPVAQAVSFLHPIDRRPVFIFPWEGVALIGTTDVDYSGNLDEESGITPAEVAYLMAAVQARYPVLGITLDDVIASFSGVRPVVGSGKDDPSEESRDHVVWQEAGLLTVTGGKLTTFRLIALDALKAVREDLPEIGKPNTHLPVLNPVDMTIPGAEALEPRLQQRLLGRYGAAAVDLVAAAQPAELSLIPGTRTLWAELRWAARSESVVHLEDLLLRRVRLGLLVKNGGAALLPQIRTICQPELGWDDNRWQAEEAAYLNLIACCYSLPPRDTIPDWMAQLAKVELERETAVALEQNLQKNKTEILILGMFGAIFVLFLIYILNRNQQKI